MSKQNCQARRVFDGWHYCRCQRSGTIEENGAWWCHQHAPSQVEARRKERTAKWEAKWKQVDDTEKRGKAIAAAQERLEKAAEALAFDAFYNVTDRSINEKAIAVRDALAALRKARGGEWHAHKPFEPMTESRPHWNGYSMP